MEERHAPVGRDRLAHELDRGRNIAGLMRDDAVKMQRLGMAGHGFATSPAQRLGGLKAPRLATLLGERQHLRQGQDLLRRGRLRGAGRLADAAHPDVP